MKLGAGLNEIVQEYWDHYPYDKPTTYAPNGFLLPNKFPTPADITATLLSVDSPPCFDPDEPSSSCLGLIYSGNYHDNIDYGNAKAKPLMVGDVPTLAKAIKDRLNGWDIRVTSGWRNPELDEAYGFPIPSGHEWGTGLDMLLPAGRISVYWGTSETEIAATNWCIVAGSAALVASEKVGNRAWENFSSQVENPSAPEGDPSSPEYVPRNYYVFSASNVSSSNAFTDCISDYKKYANRCYAKLNEWTKCNAGHIHMSENQWWLR